MKHFITILFIAASITWIVIGCATTDDIQIENVMTKLVKKERHQRGGQYVIFQYWEDVKRKDVIYFEELPLGDSGYRIGMQQPLFLKR